MSCIWIAAPSRPTDYRTAAMRSVEVRSPDHNEGIGESAMAASLSPEIRKIQETVVGMYSEHPWPLNRDTDEEMGWRLKCLGISPEDYRGRRVLDMGCGTGEYALWYALNGAANVTGIDLEKHHVSFGWQVVRFAGLPQLMGILLGQARIRTIGDDAERRALCGLDEPFGRLDVAHTVRPQLRRSHHRRQPHTRTRVPPSPPRCRLRTAFQNLATTGFSSRSSARAAV